MSEGPLAAGLMAVGSMIPGIVQAAEKPRAARMNKPKQSPEEHAAFALALGREDTILTRTGRAPLGGGSPAPAIGGASAVA